MPSPFPGMDPYLEPCWGDVHTALIAESRTALNAALPKGLVARSETRVAVGVGDGADDEDDAVRSYKPDVGVYGPADGSTGGGVMTAPVKLLLAADPDVERYLRIVHAESKRVITVIEFVSPANKVGEGLREFRRKRRELLAAGVSVVEVDLVRAGDWAALLAPHVCRPADVSPYRVTVRLPGESRAAYLFPAGFQTRLPVVQVPLRAGDPVVTLDLQSLVDRVYNTGRYDEEIDYGRDPDPPLDEADAAWADALLKSAGRR